MEQLTIIHADDDEQWRVLINTALTRMGCVVQSVESGEDLMELVAIHKFDAVIVDNNMGECKMTGLDVLKAVRALGHYKDTDVFVLSGDNIAEQVAQAGGTPISKMNFSPISEWLRKRQILEV